jgi:hypothetical protein
MDFAARTWLVKFGIYAIIALTLATPVEVKVQQQINQLALALFESTAGLFRRDEDFLIGFWYGDVHCGIFPFMQSPNFG